MGWLKCSVIDHVFFNSVEAIIAAADAFLVHISQDPMTIIGRRSLQPGDRVGFAS